MLYIAAVETCCLVRLGALQKAALCKVSSFTRPTELAVVADAEGTKDRVVGKKDELLGKVTGNDERRGMWRSFLS